MPAGMASSLRSVSRRADAGESPAVHVSATPVTMIPAAAGVVTRSSQVYAPKPERRSADHQKSERQHRAGRGVGRLPAPHPSPERARGAPPHRRPMREPTAQKSALATTGPRQQTDAATPRPRPASTRSGGIRRSRPAASSTSQSGMAVMSGGDDCGWMYVDRSRNGLRRWCQMRTCGTREKSRRRRVGS